MDPTQQPLQPPVNIHNFQPKPNYLKTILFSVLAIITLGLIAYLVFQNQKLQKQITNQQITPTVEAPSPTPKPSSSISIPPDETAGWKTYTNTKYGFSFKYPSYWMIKDVSAPGLDNQIWISSSELHMPNPNNYGQVGNGARPPISFIISQKNYSNDYKESQFDDFQSIPYFVGSLKGIKISGFSKEGQSAETIISVKIGNQYLNILPLEAEEKKLLDQILSTFKFVDKSILLTPAVISSQPLTYYVPVGWTNISDPTGIFQASYDSATTQLFEGGVTGLNLNRKIINDNQIGYKSFIGIKLISYNGGSKHQFIYNQLNNGQKPTNQDYFPDFKETEYLYDGKTCLFLNGISISQFSPVWGMCDAGNEQAFLITAYDRTDYLKTIQTIKRIK